MRSGEKITLPKKSTLTIKFAEGNSLIFQVDETKTVHYTITGGNTENVIKVEMMNNDGAYTLHTTPSSATAGTIEISAKVPTVNRVIVSVSDGSHMIMTAIDVSIAPSLDNTTITVAKPGSLYELLSEYDKTTITELTIIGSLNGYDIKVLNELPNLSVLDMENVNLEIMPAHAFRGKTSLTSIVMPKTLKTIEYEAFVASGLTGNLIIPESVTTIGRSAFSGCSGFTGSLTIPESVTTIGGYTFFECSGLTGNLTIPENVTTIGYAAFSDCSGLTNIYCKSPVPPQISEGVFPWTLSTTLYVPTNCAEIYRTAPGWSKLAFKEIIETEF